MTARKKTPPPPADITVADLLLALASFPQDGVLTAMDPTEIGVMIDNGESHPDYVMLIDWQHGEALHYSRPDIIREVIHRGAPGDDFASAQEVLDWLGKSDIVLRHPGHGHNELDGPVLKTSVELAEEFARRQS